MISVLIATYNRANVFEKSLHSFYEQERLGEQDYELIVIDNNSSDDTRVVADSFADRPGFHYVFEPVQGLSHARNRGVTESRGKYIAFLDDDVIVDRNWLEKLRRSFEETNADVVAGRTYLVFDKDPPAWLGPNFRRFLTEVDHGEKRLTMHPHSHVGGLNLAFTRDILIKAGKFDESLGRHGNELISGEETHLIEKISHLGGSIIYDPDVIVGHMIGVERMEWDYFKNLARGFGVTDARRELPSNVIYQFLRVLKAVYAYLKTGLSFLIMELAAKDEYKRKQAAWKLHKAKGFLAERWKFLWK